MPKSLGKMGDRACVGCRFSGSANFPVTTDMHAVSIISKV